MTRAVSRWLSVITEPGSRPCTRAPSADTATSTRVLPFAAPPGSDTATVEPGSRVVSDADGGPPATYRIREANPGSATSVGSVSTVRLNSEVSVSSGSTGAISSARTAR